METINRHNYEAYFLDFSEGTLSDRKEEELMHFVAENPSLKKELNNYEEICLKPPEISFKNKHKLIKQTQAQYFEITEFEYLCVASFENDCTDEEDFRLKQELKNDDKRKTFVLFNKTQLKADKSIFYRDKSGLYKKTVPITLRTVISVASAAAILLFFIFSGKIFTDNNAGNSGQKLADEILPVKLIKPTPRQIKTRIYGKTITQQEQASVTHNQTIKNSNNHVLAFDDNEPQKMKDSYKDLIVSIPDIKNEALISNINQNITSVSFKKSADIKNSNFVLLNKDKFWRYAEKGVDVWKKITNDDDIELKNDYAENGRVNEVNFIASNFQFRKTYNKK